MNAHFALPSHRTLPTVYVRRIAADTLPQDILGELRAHMPDVEDVYSVHDADGDRLALAVSRELAFSVARDHDFWPVNVH